MKIVIAALAFSIALFSCNDNSTTSSASRDTLTTTNDTSGTVKSETVTIAADTTNMKCFVAYKDENGAPKPIVLVVPEWWGLNEYPQSRAKQLADLGYFALAVDLYGNGAIAADPAQAQSFAGAFYKDPQLATQRLLAALAKAKTYSQADTSKTAAIGYCFGGSMVLNAAKLGAPFTAVVSFHGGLAGVTPQKNNIRSKILVCHGAADSFVPAAEVANFKKLLDSVGAVYTFREYPNATHAFTNPGADDNAKKFKMPIAYNPEADKNSWNDMKTFLQDAFNK